MDSLIPKVSNSLSIEFLLSLSIVKSIFSFLEVNSTIHFSGIEAQTPFYSLIPKIKKAPLCFIILLLLCFTFTATTCSISFGSIIGWK